MQGNFCLQKVVLSQSFFVRIAERKSLQTYLSPIERSIEISTRINILFTESLILAQNERWRRGLGMQVERSF